MPSHSSERRRSWSVTPGIWPAVMLAYSAQHDCSGGRTMNPAPQPLPPTPMPSATSLATPPHGGTPGPRWRRQARPWMGTTVPLDGEDFAPHPVALIIGHVADRHGSVQQEQCRGEEKEEPCRGGGEGAGLAVAQGGEALGCAPPLHPHSDAAILAEGGAGVSSEMMDDKQTTIKS